MFNLSEMQKAIQDHGLDGWLLHDFRGSNLLARRILDLEGKPTTSRRFYYFIPAHGEPLKLVHRIETSALNHLPGSTRVYLSWQQLTAEIARLLERVNRLAMEYSPKNLIPYVSRTDAGTMEVVRENVYEVVSSGNLIQLFEATWDDAQWAMHQEAERLTTAAYDLVWRFIAERIRSGGTTSEYEIQTLIMEHFLRNGMTTYSPPIVAVNDHASDPHFETTKESDTLIRQEDLLLVDLWAKMDRPRSVYSDLTRMGFVGAEVPAKFEDVFRVVARARDSATRLVREAFAVGRPLQGWEVDDACRAVIHEAGYGEAFIHRTGHNIGQEVHGNGANMDNLETREERLIIRRTCFSVEPGIYLPEFGMRSEINVYVDADGEVHVMGGPVQQQIVAILAN